MPTVKIRITYSAAERRLSNITNTIGKTTIKLFQKLILGISPVHFRACTADFFLSTMKNWIRVENIRDARLPSCLYAGFFGKTHNSSYNQKHKHDV